MVPVLVWPQRQSMGACSLDGVHPYQPQTKSATAISTTTHTISATCKGHTCPTRSKDDTVKLDVDKPLSFTQFVADNVDHDICTLDGTGTFHRMGIISTTVNLADSNDVESVQYLLPRIGRQLTAKEVAVVSGGVPIVPYLSSGRDGLLSVHFRPLVSLHRPLVKPPIGNSFLLQHICTAFESADKVVSWAGFMCRMCRTQPMAHMPQ